MASPVVGIASCPLGCGYWLAHDDGTVDAFGMVLSAGGIDPMHLKSPVVGIAAHPAGGYYLTCADGAVFAFGGAPFFGAKA